ncbi:hypothetical protein ZIOFF_024272 [Zingiber officinale]|uniref:Large ribosomal subunit protein bL12 oligomerization domain-containing protein n=1 Tax=Zingiber officinale TaxID=94328 RepID=A0A8J5HBT3_ZINOF|nr:hypothetical protein ZIOFF_024272 [Zingiber officinale]
MNVVGKRKEFNEESGKMKSLKRWLYSAPSTTSSLLESPSKALKFATQLFPRRGCHRATFIRPPAAVSPKIEEIGTIISNLTLEEACSLVDHLQDRLGVSAATFAPAAVAIAPGAATDAASGGEAAVEEKTEFDVVIEEVPSNARIATIKVIYRNGVSPVFSILLSSFTGFGISISMNFLLIEYLRWRARRTLRSVQLNQSQQQNKARNLARVEDGDDTRQQDLENQIQDPNPLQHGQNHS